MQHFKRKREIRRKVYSKPVIILLIIILGFVAHGTWGIWQKTKQSKAALDVSETKLEELENRKQKTENKIERLHTETGLEEEIRGRFDVAREGEQVIVIIDAEADEVLEEEEKEKGVQGFFNTIRSWFQ